MRPGLHRFWRAALPTLSAVALPVALASQAPGEKPAGYGAESAARQRQIEAAFRAIPSPERAREWHRRFTADPHPAGSEENNALARYIAGEWKKQGLEDVRLHRYDVLNTAPRSVSLAMVAPVAYEASLREEAVDADPATRHPKVAPAFLGMSTSADVEAAVVYANSGNPEDYAVLRNHGITVAGKIVLVRYSNPYSYRGFKALTAEREGAAGILIYSDPAEDGFTRGRVFPDGPWGPESHLQRGAITYDFIVPGDPLTPGWPSLPGARQVKPADARSLPKIAGLPLSWKDARPLLENMDGPVAPKAWQGGLPIEYRLGGGRVRVRMKIEMDNRVSPNYVVEGRIRGQDLPDEWIVLGNHRDAWVFGGVDPASGSASMMEVTRAMGEMLKAGTRPRRTLVFCSWDGEEVGLTGSTEWGEQFADELMAKAIAYLNVDSSASGPDFQPDAVGSLAPLIVSLAGEFQDPASGRPLVEALRAARAKAMADEGVTRPPTDEDLVDVRIGSGSDHTVFLNHLGIPTVGLTFDGPYGVYHSVYDGFVWVNRFGDPGYRYHTLLSQYWGSLALRLANADLLPLDFAAYGRHLRSFVEALAKATPNGRLDLSGVRAGIDALERAGGGLDEAMRRALAGGALAPAVARDVNAGIRQVERNWLHPDGIPGRPWFRHTLYAARYTYAHLELPGLTEAAEEQDWDRAARQAAILEQALERNAALLDDLARRLRTAGGPAGGAGRDGPPYAGNPGAARAGRASSMQDRSPAVPPLAVDLIVLDGTGTAPDSLAPSDLSVTVDGQARSVLWIRRVSRGPGALADAAARRAAGQPGAAYAAEPSRAVVIAVDEGSLPVGAERQAVQGASALLDRLGMNDRVAVVRLPLASDPVTTLATERPAIRDAIGRITGRFVREESGQRGITPDSRHVGDHRLGARRVEEAERPTPDAYAPDDSAVAASDGLDGLVRTLTALSRLPGRKAVAFFSAGLDGSDARRFTAAARAAADARASLYVFRLSVPVDRRDPAADPSQLARLAQAAGGVLVQLGRDPVKDVEPLVRELAACFQIGIQRAEGDGRGAPRALRVEARRAGLVVRAPSIVGLRAPATEDVEPPPAPPAPPERPREPGTYHGAGRVSPPAPAAPADSARSPELEIVLAKLGDYVQGYIGQYTAVVAEESYHQTVPFEHRQRR
ncbi:MAG: Glutamate carboxypeptidase, partial [Acidobacteria bacterium]|nr:Glutamate carboxypeptidase [Acidobacteriota bacterium]